MLLLVNNYTGDRMAFEMAEELSQADGVTVRTLFIDDDVAVEDSTYTVGRRGVAGNFFVMKACGAAAERGADLDEVYRIGEKVNAVTRTMGMALTACTPPAKGSPLFDLPEDAVEMGVGIHGEPVASARSSSRRTRWCANWSARSWTTCRSPPATASP